MRSPPRQLPQERSRQLESHLVSLMWMSFTTMVPLTMGVVPGRLNRQDVYLEDAAIPSRFASWGYNFSSLIQKGASMHSLIIPKRVLMVLIGQHAPCNSLVF